MGTKANLTAKGRLSSSPTEAGEETVGGSGEMKTTGSSSSSAEDSSVDEANVKEATDKKDILPTTIATVSHANRSSQTDGDKSEYRYEGGEGGSEVNVNPKQGSRPGGGHGISNRRAGSQYGHSVQEGLDGRSPLATKGVSPEIVAESGLSDEGFVQDGRAGRDVLESEASCPEIVAAPGPNVESSRMMRLSSPRGNARMDVAIPTSGNHLEDGGGGRGSGSVPNPARQMHGPTSAAVVASLGLALDESSTTDSREQQMNSNYAMDTPLDAEVVTNEVTSGPARRRGGRPDLQQAAQVPYEEEVYDGIRVDKDEQARCSWSHLSRYKYMCGLGILLICLAVAIGVPVALKRRHDSIANERSTVLASLTPNPMVVPTLKPSVAPTTSLAPSSRLSAVKATILRAAEIHSITSTVDALEYEESPQRKALEWLVNQDETFPGFIDTNRLIQRFALATLFHSTGWNESWREHYNFLSNASECDWRVGDIHGYDEGVLCGEDNQTVKGINLGNSTLVGTIPNELGLLVDLEMLILYENALDGTLPPVLANLSKLEVLHLWDNFLSGTLPFTPNNTNLPNLREVLLGNNNFTGTLPRGLFMPTNMTSLDLSANQFSGTLPTEIGKLLALQNLWLDENELSGQLPRNIGALTTLQQLSLFDNMFIGQLPSGIWALTKLEWLDLEINEFRGQLPSNIGALTELQYLFLRDNELSGTLPSNIGVLAKLQELYLERNRFHGPLPSSIGALTDLRWLLLHQNKFNGSLPGSLFNLTALESLYLSGNKLTGTIPDIFRGMRDLNALHLDINGFTGSIPPSFSSLENLYSFSIANTSVTGNMTTFCKNHSMDDLEWIADCYGDNPEVICDCCFVCCSDYEKSSSLTTSDLGLGDWWFDGKFRGCFNLTELDKWQLDWG